MAKNMMAEQPTTDVAPSSAEKNVDSHSSAIQQPSRITNDLRGFYAEHGVDVDRLVDGERSICFASRFVRLNRRFDKQETLEKLKVTMKY